MNKYQKKLIGTSLLIVMILGVFLITSDTVRAQYMEIMNTVITDGYVGAVNHNDGFFTLYNAGVNPLLLSVSGDTDFTGNLASFADLDPGDWVKVVAKIENGNAIAKTVKGNGDHGYGVPGESVVIDSATLLAKVSADTLLIKSGVTNITIKINASTEFVGQDLTNLGVGETLTVIGTDSGTEFLAETIISQWQN